MYALKRKKGKKMQDVYVFDLDGTLVDSMTPAVAIVLSFLDEHGVVYAPDIVKILTPLGFKGIARYYATELGVPMQEEEIYRVFQDKLKVAYASEIRLKTGVEDALKRLKSDGASLNVLTASPHAFTDVCLQNNGVYGLFDNVFSSEDFSMLKSDVRIYAEVEKRLGSPFVMVDDSVTVVKTAKRAGMRTVGVYEPFFEDEWAEMQRVADKTIMDFSSL